MLSTAADALQLAQAAPWLAVGTLSLVAAAWVYRQGRRNLNALEARLGGSSVRQGKRIGDTEQAVGLLDLRRRQVEWVLLDMGVDLPFWPADGPDQPRPRQRRPEPAPDPVDDVDTAWRTSEAPRVPVPPLPADVGARHRRETTS